MRQVSCSRRSRRSVSLVRRRREIVSDLRLLCGTRFPIIKPYFSPLTPVEPAGRTRVTRKPDRPAPSLIYILLIAVIPSDSLTLQRAPLSLVTRAAYLSQATQNKISSSLSNQIAMPYSVTQLNWLPSIAMNNTTISPRYHSIQPHDHKLFKSFCFTEYSFKLIIFESVFALFHIYK